MVPEHLMIHDLVRVRPAATSDDYGTNYDYGTAAARAGFRGWLQQDRRAELFTDARDTLDQSWLLVTNYLDIDGNDRIEWPVGPFGLATFRIDGPPEPAYTPRGYDHVEATLRIVEG
jgi:hypothetical protein